MRIVIVPSMLGIHVINIEKINGKFFLQKLSYQHVNDLSNVMDFIRVIIAF